MRTAEDIYWVVYQCWRRGAEATGRSGFQEYRRLLESEGLFDLHRAAHIFVTHRMDERPFHQLWRALQKFGWNPRRFLDLLCRAGVTEAERVEAAAAASIRTGRFNSDKNVCDCKEEGRIRRFNGTSNVERPKHATGYLHTKPYRMVAVQFPYGSLLDNLQSAVNKHLDFKTKKTLRSTNKLFLRFPADSLLLGGRWPLTEFAVTAPGAIPGYDSRVAWRIYISDVLHPPKIHVEVDGEVDVICPDISCYIEYFVGGRRKDYGLLLRMKAGSASHLRILDKLMLRLGGAELHVALRNIQPPLWMNQLRALRCGTVTIYPVFGNGAQRNADKRYLELDDWLPQEIPPDRAYVCAGGPRPRDYLEIYLDAFQKLRDCPVVRLTQYYEREAECILSLSLIRILLERIVETPRPSTPDGRRLVIVDTHVTNKIVDGRPVWPQLPNLQKLHVAYENMVNEVTDATDMYLTDNIQLYRMDLSKAAPLPSSFCSNRYHPSFANFVVAQNYSSRHQVSAQLLQLYKGRGRDAVSNLQLIWEA